MRIGRLSLLAVALLALLALGLACGEDPMTPQLALSASSRFVSVHEESTLVVRDSVVVTAPGEVAWRVRHAAGATWNTLLDSSGVGSGLARWRRDATGLLGGHYVDTIVVERTDGAASATVVDTLEVREVIAEFITVRRAWLPGERDAEIQKILTYGALGMMSDLAPQVLPLDSIAVVARNPAFPGAIITGFTGMLSTMPPTTAGMISTGLDLHQVDTSHPPQAATDTLDWLVVFWYMNTEPTYKGFTVIVSKTAAHGPVTLNTAAFDAAAGTTGGGGGEARTATGEYWEANGGTMQITSNTTGSGTPSTITSGVWTGGTQRNGTFGGRLFKVSMPRILPTPQTTATFTFDFRTAPLAAAGVDCIFPSPCTGQAAALVAALRQGPSAVRRLLAMTPDEFRAHAVRSTNVQRVRR